jgi:hypothetical protein
MKSLHSSKSLTCSLMIFILFKYRHERSYPSLVNAADCSLALMDIIFLLAVAIPLISFRIVMQLVILTELSPRYYCFDYPACKTLPPELKTSVWKYPNDASTKVSSSGIPFWINCGLLSLLRLPVASYPTSPAPQRYRLPLVSRRPEWWAPHYKAYTCDDDL